MKEITDGLVDGVFKDAPPLKTVERIKNILRQYDIETEEHWNESSVPYCYSIRVTIRGTAFGVNGKGLTREFALASGYGELMERLQLGYVSGGNSAQKSGDLSQGDRQSDKVSGEMLLTRNRQWYEQYARIIQKITGSTVTADAIVNRYADSEGNVHLVQYFDTEDEAYVGINGMEGQPVKEIDFSLRTQEHIDAINADLDWLSSNVGLGGNFYKFDGKTTKTATEVISESSDAFRTKVHYDIIVNDVIYDLVKVICEMEGIKTKKITIVPDDSIIEDKNAEALRAQQEVSVGLRSKKSYLMDIKGMTEQEADDELQKINDEKTSNQAAFGFVPTEE